MASLDLDGYFLFSRGRFSSVMLKLSCALAYGRSAFAESKASQ
jgi:hypothetical protein